jgi:hypothetical protein
MPIAYDDGSDLGVDLRVGNGIECKVYVWLYDENGQVIPGDLPGTTCMFEMWADDDDAPEYYIPKKVLGKNKRLKLVQVYRPGVVGPGTFGSASTFIQDGRPTQLRTYGPVNIEMGDEISQPILLVGS